MKEDATKLISEANQRFLAAQEEAKKRAEEEAAEAARWKRNITSNWTRWVKCCRQTGFPSRSLFCGSGYFFPAPEDIVFKNVWELFKKCLKYIFNTFYIYSFYFILFCHLNIFFILFMHLNFLIIKPKFMLEPGQTDGSGCCQIPRLRAASKPCRQSYR